LEASSGDRYAEAHHLKPLGAPHNGPDIANNIICVCPNCHAKLDYGIMRIEIPKLNLDIRHKIGAEFINYHNNNILEKVL
jgi:predicted HNH restriction endonuclease